MHFHIRIIAGRMEIRVWRLALPMALYCVIQGINRLSKPDDLICRDERLRVLLPIGNGLRNRDKLFSQLFPGFLEGLFAHSRFPATVLGGALLCGQTVLAMESCSSRVEGPCTLQAPHWSKTKLPELMSFCA